MAKAKKKPKTRQVSVTLTDERIAALDARAQRESRTRSQMAGLILASALTESEAQSAPGAA